MVLERVSIAKVQEEINTEPEEKIRGQSRSGTQNSSDFSVWKPPYQNSKNKMVGYGGFHTEKSLEFWVPDLDWPRIFPPAPY